MRVFFPSLLLFLTLVLSLLGADPPLPPRLLTPADAVLLAYSDCTSLPPKVAADTRYLWLPNLPEEHRARLRVILNAHCNQMSNQSDLTPLREVKDAGRQLLAVYLPDYGWETETWDNFADNEPYFYATLEIVEAEVYDRQYWPGGYEDGRYYEAGWYRVKKAGVRTKKRVLAPWLAVTPGGKEAVAGLTKLTYAKAPIVNAVYFFQSTATSGDGRKPDYYDLLGVKDEASFQARLGVELEKDRAFAQPLLEAVGISGVTQEPRAIERLEKRGGGYWRSHDVAKGSAKDQKNALRIFGTDEKGKILFQADASEQYGHLPNGLWAFGLFDAKGVKQGAAPDNIAADSLPIQHNDHRVKVCVSCIRCHVKGGLQDIDPWVRSNFSPPNLQLLFGDREGKKYDPEDLRRLKQQYGRNLETFLNSDRARYQAALFEITELKSEEYAKEFAAAWAYCADSLVDAAWAAREIGCTEELLLSAIRHQAALGKADPVLSVLTLKKRGIPLTQWYETYPLMQQYLAEFPK